MSHALRLREVIGKIVLADQVEFDVFGIGEHRREDYMAGKGCLLNLFHCLVIT